MSLKLAGEEVFLEKLEYLVYAPGLQDSGDLEAATKAITATAKPATPDYTVSLTTAAPTDSRISVKRLALRLQATVDSFNAGATVLYYSVEVNGTERLAGSWAATGEQLAGVNLVVGTQINLGTANELKVYLWVDAGNAVVSLCQLWQVAGHYGTGSTATQSQLQVTHRGLAMLHNFYAPVVGSGAGSMSLSLAPGIGPNAGTEYVSSGGKMVLLVGTHNFWVSSSVATDLSYFRTFFIILRSEQ